MVRADDGADRVSAREVTELLGELTAVPHVAGVDDPYATPGAIVRATGAPWWRTCASTW